MILLLPSENIWGDYYLLSHSQIWLKHANYLSDLYNRENETYNFLKRNVQFSLFFHPIKAKAFNHHLSGN